MKKYNVQNYVRYKNDLETVHLNVTTGLKKRNPITSMSLDQIHSAVGIPLG